MSRSKLVPSIPSPQGASSLAVGPTAPHRSPAGACGAWKRSPLWEKVVAAALGLAESESERHFLENTTLVDIASRRIVVLLAADAAEAAPPARLRSLLNRALGKVGLDCYRVRLLLGPEE